MTNGKTKEMYKIISIANGLKSKKEVNVNGGYEMLKLIFKRFKRWINYRKNKRANEKAFELWLDYKAKFWKKKIKELDNIL